MQNRRKFSDAQVRIYRAEYAGDETITVMDMSRRYSIPVTTMRNLICGRSYPEVDGAVPIRNPHNCPGNFRCPAWKNDLIRRMLAKGYSTNSIANEVEVSTSHVHYIRNGTYAYQA